MKTITLLFCLVYFQVFTVFADILQNPKTVKSPQVILSYSVFNSPGEGPFIETYLSIAGNSCVFVKSENNKFIAKLEIVMLFKQKEEIKNFKKYILSSPETDDTTKLDFNFIDQQRVLLPNGTYDFEIKITDLNSQSQPLNYTESISISFPDKQVNISDIQIIDSYKKAQTPGPISKNGYDIIPLVMNYFPPSRNTVIFYCEIYKTDEIFGTDGKYLLKYYIESNETPLAIDEYTVIKKESAKPVKVLLTEMDISKLSSGNYNLVVEIRDKNNIIVASKKMFFQRNNPDIKPDFSKIENLNVANTFIENIKNIKEMKDYVRSLYPISSSLENSYADNLLQNNDLTLLQKYFYNFWYKRNPDNPEKPWLAYLEQVKKVNKVYGTRIKKGYETDRGRVYLQYGPPNTVVQNENEPSAYPYEIWHYYTLKNQSNRKFVFYSSDLVTNDYQLIHSDAIGERADFTWQVKVYNRNTTPSNIDRDSPTKHYGGKADDYYKQPR
ncbi:MAG: GWxTD domain-containing protein [Bacteroidales bacterium]|nr:GWxTD domain-containing protein [Bacteroidales bacterium]